jgi:uncharacterized protein (DUF1684 family)
MKKLVFGFSVSCLLCSMAAHGQKTYADSIAKHREQYIQEHLVDTHSPIKSQNVKGLQFFKPDAGYRVVATFTETPGSAPFMIETHSGKKKPYKEYGVLQFSIHDTALTLHVYQNLDLIKSDIYKNYIFVPFNDRTNYITTYAGGRYMDLSITDIKDGKLVLDFNKCYNPLCAYADGYSCPIPPDENKLPIEIKAGEKIFLWP